MPALVVFDVDGTLCDTCDVDEECYLRAVGEVLGRDLRTVDWSAAPQVTDVGILAWLWRLYRQRPPTAEETAAVVNRFVELLTDALRREPARFVAVPGAPEAVSVLASLGGPVAAATGGWKEAACLKLEAAQISPAILLASSNDSADRMTVFRLAAERAASGGSKNRDVVLVGDGIWDLDVASRLKWRFVGIARQAKATRLRSAGAKLVLADLRDLTALKAAIGIGGDAGPIRRTAAG